MHTPVVLTIAGSDNSAGAGAQADLKTISALGGYALTAITCVVAEVPGRVTAIHPIPPAIVAEQIRLLLHAYPIAAIKTGMLYSSEILLAVLAALADITCPLIVDPVMVATSGDPLLHADAIALYRTALFPRAPLITPNLDEVRTLLGTPVTTLPEMRTAGLHLARQHHCPFLIKGGHLTGPHATDLLCTPTGQVTEYTAPRTPGVKTHGTGCTTSAAIATHLAHGLPLPAAIAEAKKYVTRAIAHTLQWQCQGQTTQALHHFTENIRRPSK